jgi:hypothetical protein
MRARQAEAQYIGAPKVLEGMPSRPPTPFYFDVVVV